MSYQVSVVEGRYRMRGDFHTIEPNQAIRNEIGKLCGVTNPRRLVHTHSYGGEHEFFAGIAEGRLIGTRCDNADCEDVPASPAKKAAEKYRSCIQEPLILDLIANDSYL